MLPDLGVDLPATLLARDRITSGLAQGRLLHLLTTACGTKRLHSHSRHISEVETIADMVPAPWPILVNRNPGHISQEERYRFSQLKPSPSACTHRVTLPPIILTYRSLWLPCRIWLDAASATKFRDHAAAGLLHAP
jgi:hypothetical protein